MFSGFAAPVVAGAVAVFFGGATSAGAQRPGTVANGAVLRGQTTPTTAGSSTVSVAPAVGSVGTRPLPPTVVWRGQRSVPQEAYLRQGRVIGSSARRIPGAVVTPNRVSPVTVPARTGFTARSGVRGVSGRDHHRDHSRRRHAPYYYGNYPGDFGFAEGGYGLPFLYVQTFGYPFSTLPFQPAETAAVVYGASAAEAAPGVDAEPDRLVQDVQSELTRRGYYAGEATGLVTKDFQVALRRFQTDQNLAGSGLLNEATLYALGLN